jgi:hypothetical protein
LEVDVQQGNFKILWLVPQVLILFLVEKWIPSSELETTKIGQKNRRNLGGYSTNFSTWLAFWQFWKCNIKEL